MTRSYWRLCCNIVWYCRNKVANLNITTTSLLLIQSQPSINCFQDSRTCNI
jgi:hypothetical protein